MHFSNFTKFVLLSTSVALQARAGLSFPKVTAGEFGLIQTTTVSPSSMLANGDLPKIYLNIYKAAANLSV
ncbi:hypothetical protein B0H13DRAFT_2369713 [Mycena leptocephala]|nr:hypothetical protein B0H13DRAFT_2369713 [Mycena leptocephala]